MSAPSTLPTSRTVAAATGIPRYVGLPCAVDPTHGRIRHTSNGACIECAVHYGRAYKQARAEQERERKRKWKVDNRARHLASKRESADRHRDAIRARQAVYREADPYGTIAMRREQARAKSAERAAAKHLQREARQAQKMASRAEHQARRDEIAAERQALAYAAGMLRDADGKPLERLQLYNRIKRGRRRAEKFGAVCTLSVADLVRVGEWQGWRCAYCGSTDRLTIDHVVPISKGGHHVASNVQWLCWTHNADKRDRTDAEYRRLRAIPCATPWDVL